MTDRPSPRPVHVVDYDPGWPDAFEAVRAVVWPAVSHVATAIEHVGSTSVPGLAAKPVIDIDVVVPSDRLGEGIAALKGLGYEHRGDLGIPDREAFRAPDTGGPRHHLYLCPGHSRALANHLAVREYLRAHPDAARRYGALKRELAGRFANDVDGYVEGKSVFLATILRAAGFDESELDDIERMNRRQ